MLFGGEAPTLDADTELASIPGDTEDDETDVPVKKKKPVHFTIILPRFDEIFQPYLMTCDDY